MSDARKAAEDHYGTLIRGLAYIVRGSWWPEDDAITNGVREHVVKMRDAAEKRATPHQTRGSLQPRASQRPGRFPGAS